MRRCWLNWGMIDIADARTGTDADFVTRVPLPPQRLDALSRDILKLKRKLNAVILAHNYQVPEIQDIADYVGDSLGLSQQAAKTPADVIVFWGPFHGGNGQNPQPG